jgi:hypothetical protein
MVGHGSESQPNLAEAGPGDHRGARLPGRQRIIRINDLKVPGKRPVRMVIDHRGLRGASGAGNRTFRAAVGA